MTLRRILTLVTLILFASATSALPARATSATVPSSSCCVGHPGHSAEHHSMVEAHADTEVCSAGQGLAGGECTRCCGSRKCSVCDGSGRNNSGDACSICNGSGKCYFCGGSGKGS